MVLVPFSLGGRSFFFLESVMGKLSELEVENLKQLAMLYEKKYEFYLDQNRRVRDQSVLAVAVTTTAFGLLGPSINFAPGRGTFILFAVAAFIFLAQSVVTLWLYWPYESRSVLEDDWQKDWDVFVDVDRETHWRNLANAYLTSIEEEKSVATSRDRGYWFLLASSACCPLLLLLAYMFS